MKKQDILSLPPIKIIRPTVEIPSNLPDGVQEQVNYFLSDYPRIGPELVSRYLELVMSDAYRSRAMGRSDNQLFQPNRTQNKNEPKKNSQSTSKSSRTQKAN